VINNKGFYHAGFPDVGSSSLTKFRRHGRSESGGAYLPASWRGQQRKRKIRRCKMAVKIIIKRRVSKEKESELLPLLIEMRSKATAQPGYITGETLRSVKDPEDYIVISTWQSEDVWKAWESSKDRAQIQKKIDALLGKKTEYGIYLYG